MITAPMLLVLVLVIAGVVSWVGLCLSPRDELPK